MARKKTLLKKTHVVRVRVTEAERDRLREVSGGNLARWIRHATLNERAGGPMLREDIIAVRSELARIGNNVNQIARKVNQGGEADGLAAAMQELDATRRHLNHVLSLVQ